MFNRNVLPRFAQKLQNQICLGDYFFLKDSQKFSIFRRNYASATKTKHNFGLSPEEIEPFSAVTPELVKIVNEFKLVSDFPDLNKRAISLIEYTSKIADNETSKATLAIYKLLAKPQDLTTENTNLAYLLGWLTEMVQGVLFMQRDPIDDIRTRNNTATWQTTNLEYCFQVPNDAVVLESFIFIVLKKYFGQHKNYVKIMDLFHDTFYKSLQGHNLELIDKDIDKFDMKMLENIAKFKIAPCLYTLPMLSAWYLTDYQESSHLEEVKDIFNDMALFKKIQADYLDSFDHQAKNSNIINGICSWLLIKSMEKSDKNQKTILKEHYGNPQKNQTESINRITDLYKEFNLTSDFENFKNGQYARINEKIEKINDEAIKNYLNQILTSNFSN